MNSYVKAILWCVSLIVFENALHGQCVTPYTKGYGIQIGTVFRYTIDANITPERRIAIQNAMYIWANIGVAGFTPVSAGQTPNLRWKNATLPTGVAGEAWISYTGGWVYDVSIDLTSNTAILDSANGYLKVALHELGHAFGLDDLGGSGGTSIMNQLKDKDDGGGNMPTWLTPCDISVATQNADPDQDNDGYFRSVDCNDFDSSNHPNADNDGDGYYDFRCGGNDCMDFFNIAYPDSPAWMLCSNVDLNCNGSADILDCSGYGSPILISTDGGRITLTARADGVMFDLLGTGEKIQIPWTVADSDDAWLVMDRNYNGTIDDGTELFGTVTPQPPSQPGEIPNGFAALAVFDEAENGGNNDRFIDSTDAIFSYLQLWLDSNHNGISEADELYNLTEFGIIKIDLKYKDAFKVDEYGNIGRYRSKVYRAHGYHVGRWAWDVLLKLQ